MSDVLGFEIAVGIIIFLFALMLVIPCAAMPFRAWWYMRVGKGGELPPDVKKYLFKSGLKELRKVENPSFEQEKQIAVELFVAACSAEASELESGDLLQEAFCRLGKIPLEHCASCKGPIFTHEAIKKDDKFYCASCGGSTSSSPRITPGTE